MYVRLAFAVAAHLESEILLVDEVLAVGDAAFQQKCLGKMEEASASGRTVLLVSHNMPTITRLCERAIWLNDGHVVRDGAAASVVGAYLSSALSSPSERQWPDRETAPGDDCVWLRSVRVVDEDRQTVDHIDVRRGVGIEVTFEIVEQKYPFVPAIYLKNERDVAAFLAIDTETAWRNARPAGRYVTTAWIPPNLLNEGRMFVTVSLATFTSGSKSIKRAVALDVVAFQVVDMGEGGTARGDFVGVWVEPVRPLLKWTTRVGELTPALDDVPVAGRVADGA
jgi:lipopolysaccharide transport system ATP-binding protein